MHGVQKTSPAVILVVESDSAKSTVLDPVDPVFGELNVQHKPVDATAGAAGAGRRCEVALGLCRQPSRSFESEEPRGREN